jgi:membrane protease YdiL (CAAX protease family)
MLFHTLLRIPFGTALAEELLFRGALQGIFEVRHSRRVARALSGLLFGLWHVIPTVQQLATHPARGAVGSRATARAGVVAGVIAATMLAGYGFAWLRDRSGSLAAPVVAHAALNGFGLLAGWLVARVQHGQP